MSSKPPIINTSSNSGDSKTAADATTPVVDAKSNLDVNPLAFDTKPNSEEECYLDKGYFFLEQLEKELYEKYSSRLRTTIEQHRSIILTNENRQHANSAIDAEVQNIEQQYQQAVAKYMALPRLKNYNNIDPKFIETFLQLKLNSVLITLSNISRQCAIMNICVRDENQETRALRLSEICKSSYFNVLEAEKEFAAAKSEIERAKKAYIEKEKGLGYWDDLHWKGVYKTVGQEYTTAEERLNKAHEKLRVKRMELHLYKEFDQAWSVNAITRVLCNIADAPNASPAPNPFTNTSSNALDNQSTQSDNAAKGDKGDSKASKDRNDADKKDAATKPSSATSSSATSSNTSNNSHTLSLSAYELSKTNASTVNTTGTTSEATSTASSTVAQVVNQKR